MSERKPKRMLSGEQKYDLWARLGYLNLQPSRWFLPFNAESI